MSSGNNICYILININSRIHSLFDLFLYVARGSCTSERCFPDVARVILGYMEEGLATGDRLSRQLPFPTPQLVEEMSYCRSWPASQIDTKWDAFRGRLPSTVSRSFLHMPRLLGTRNLRLISYRERLLRGRSSIVGDVDLSRHHSMIRGNYGDPKSKFCRGRSTGHQSQRRCVAILR